MTTMTSSIHQLGAMRPETPYSNPLAPQWMYPDWGYDDYCESEFTYTFPLTVPTAGLAGQKLQFGYDSEFRITDWNIFAVDQDTANASVEVRLTDADGKRRVNAFIQILNSNGAVPADWVVPPGGNQRLDVRNLTGGSVDIWVVFRGRKRFQQIPCTPAPRGFCAQDYVPLWCRYSVAPPGWVDEPFVYSFAAWNQAAPFDSTQESVPCQLDTDAVFYLRTLSLHIVNSDGSTATSARLVDPYGNRTVLQANPNSLTLPYAVGSNFGGAGVVSTFGRTVYPEIVCPAGGIMTLDLRLTVTGGTSVGTLRMQGVKRQQVQD